MSYVSRFNRIETTIIVKWRDFMTNNTVSVLQPRTFLNKKVHVLDVEVFAAELISLIDEHFVEICEGEIGGNLSTLKKYVKEFIETKDQRTKMGAAAEFFV